MSGAEISAPDFWLKSLKGGARKCFAGTALFRYKYFEYKG